MSELGQPHSSDLGDAPIVGLAEFERCFEENFALVHRFIARRVGTALADDLAAETFATAFRRRRTFNPGLGRLLHRPAWLLGIATNLLRQHWRAEERALGLGWRLEAELPSAGTEHGPEEQATAGGLASRIAQALASLPAEQRDVLLLHAWGGLAHEEIAAALGLRPGTVRSRLWRARAAVRSELLASGLGCSAFQGQGKCDASGQLAVTDGSRGGNRHAR